MTVSVTVDLGDRSYPVLIGPALYDDLAARLEQHTGAERYFIISDKTVAPLYLKALTDTLDIADTYIVDGGEASKSFAVYQAVCEQFSNTGVIRNTAVIALGGGVVGDLAGFVAATLLRGIKYVQLPTTLLAQVDSSVGGKTGINSPAGKNLIGAFYQPSLVLADTDVLDTLPARQMKAGYAEILKYGLIDDPDFFDWLDDNGTKVLDRETSALQYAVEKSCLAKARVVAGDETEQGRRALLNLGHSFGHALEVDAGYDGRLLHGEAVAIGMDMALALSVRLGICPAADLERLRAHYDKTGLWPAYRPALSAERMIAHMAKDKKNTQDQIVLILSRGIGKAFVDKTVRPAVLKEFLENYLKPIEDRAHGN